MQNRVQNLIELHQRFWSGEEMSHPLVAFRLASDFFFSTHFKASRALMIPGKEITPDMIEVEAFMDDYKRVAEETQQISQDAFWVAEPFTGFPWIEAICGCQVYATENSYITHPCLSSVEEHEKIFSILRTHGLKNIWNLQQSYIKNSRVNIQLDSPLQEACQMLPGRL